MDGIEPNFSFFIVLWPANSDWEYPVVDDTKRLQNVTVQPGGWLGAALAIALGQSGSVAAAAGGVTLRTLRRWNRKPHFQKLVSELRTQLLSETMGRLIASNTAAVDTLAALLKDPQSTVRLGAAGKLLDMTLRCRHQLELATEIQELKDFVHEIKQQQQEQERARGYSRSSN